MGKIGLKEAIEALRKELSESILVSEGKQVRFEVGQIELEFQIAIEQTLEGKGGIKFWVVELGGGASSKDSTVHKVKIPLKPLMRNGEPVLTSVSGNTPE
jgi:Trypsin-co-occurring domain 2